MAPEPKFLWDEMPVSKLNDARKTYRIELKKRDKILYF